MVRETGPKAVKTPNPAKAGSIAPINLRPPGFPALHPRPPRRPGGTPRLMGKPLPAPSPLSPGHPDSPRNSRAAHSSMGFRSWWGAQLAGVRRAAGRGGTEGTPISSWPGHLQHQHSGRGGWTVITEQDRPALKPKEEVRRNTLLSQAPPPSLRGPLPETWASQNTRSAPPNSPEF